MKNLEEEPIHGQGRSVVPWPIQVTPRLSSHFVPVLLLTEKWNPLQLCQLSRLLCGMVTVSPPASGWLYCLPKLHTMVAGSTRNPHKVAQEIQRNHENKRMTNPNPKPKTFCYASPPLQPVHKNKLLKQIKPKQNSSIKKLPIHPHTPKHQTFETVANVTSAPWYGASVGHTLSQTNNLEV